MQEKFKFECKRCNAMFCVDQETIQNLAKQELSVYCPRCRRCVVRGRELRKMLGGENGARLD